MSAGTLTLAALAVQLATLQARFEALQRKGQVKTDAAGNVLDPHVRCCDLLYISLGLSHMRTKSEKYLAPPLACALPNIGR